MELYLEPKKKKTWRKIEWTDKMIYILKSKFANTYNKILAKELNISWRSLVRKARELNLEKDSDFLEARRDEISKMAQDAHPGNKHKGNKGWCVPNSEKSRFKPGNISIMKTDPEVVKKVTEKRNATIKSERVRIRYGLVQKTKLKLK